MQQGIDYTKKQQQLKPRLMEMRALENNGMLGDNLNYAIDLFQGNPEAIKKLIQDKKIDINSLVSKSTDEWGNPVEGAQPSEYIPNNHRISEAQYKSQEALEDIKQSPAYSRVLDYLSNLASDKLFGDSDIERGFGALFSSGLSSAGNTMAENLLKG